jgi:hypothetical protein
VTDDEIAYVISRYIIAPHGAAAFDWTSHTCGKRVSVEGFEYSTLATCYACIADYHLPITRKKVTIG